MFLQRKELCRLELPYILAFPLSLSRIGAFESSYNRLYIIPMRKGPDAMRGCAPPFILICLAALLSCGGKPKTEGPVNHYYLTGKIVSLDPQTHSATIAHEDIKDANGKVWMKGMTMDFPVKDPAEFAKLRPGMAITARVTQRESDFEYWIDNIQAREQPSQKQ